MDVLPIEILSHVLNGLDDCGRPLFDPRWRFAARATCRLWANIIMEPSRIQAKAIVRTRRHVRHPYIEYGCRCDYDAHQTGKDLKHLIATGRLVVATCAVALGPLADAPRDGASRLRPWCGSDIVLHDAVACAALSTTEIEPLRAVVHGPLADLMTPDSATGYCLMRALDRGSPIGEADGHYRQGAIYDQSRGLLFDERDDDDDVYDDGTVFFVDMAAAAVRHAHLSLLDMLLSTRACAHNACVHLLREACIADHADVAARLMRLVSQTHLQPPHSDDPDTDYYLRAPSGPLPWSWAASHDAAYVLDLLLQTCASASYDAESAASSALASHDAESAVSGTLTSRDAKAAVSGMPASCDAESAVSGVLASHDAEPVVSGMSASHDAEPVASSVADLVRAWRPAGDTKWQSKAAKHGALRVLKVCVRRGVALDHADLLCKASLFGQSKVVRWLLARMNEADAVGCPDPAAESERVAACLRAMHSVIKSYSLGDMVDTFDAIWDSMCAWARPLGGGDGDGATIDERVTTCWRIALARYGSLTLGVHMLSRCERILASRVTEPDWNCLFGTAIKSSHIVAIDDAVPVMCAWGMPADFDLWTLVIRALESVSAPIRPLHGRHYKGGPVWSSDAVFAMCDREDIAEAVMFLVAVCAHEGPRSVGRTTPTQWRRVCRIAPIPADSIGPSDDKGLFEALPHWLDAHGLLAPPRRSSGPSNHRDAADGSST